MQQHLLHGHSPPCETSNNLAVIGQAAQVKVGISHVAGFDAPPGSLSSLLVRCEGPFPAGYLGHDGDDVAFHITLLIRYASLSYMCVSCCLCVNAFERHWVEGRVHLILHDTLAGDMIVA